ncbi:MAG TPA: LLM class F420-dependent oxidoreductase, partial [Mycobacterium sp.]|nr:LLM class F420-dependent oxidoreductase [Mycobacterium sp.]
AAVLDGHCAAVGRDPATVERSSGVEGRDAETVTANAEALAGLGVTLMTVGCDGPDYDLGAAEALIRWRGQRG